LQNGGSPYKTLIDCHPGKDQYGKRKVRFPLTFIFNALQAFKMAGLPAPREALNESALPQGTLDEEVLRPQS
jgi:hypothetical protein